MSMQAYKMEETMSVTAKKEESGTKLIVDKILNGVSHQRQSMVDAAQLMLMELADYPEDQWKVTRVTIDFEKGLVESEMTSKSTLRMISNSYEIKD